MTKQNGAEPPDPLEEYGAINRELEQSEWEEEDEITAEHLIDAMKAGAALAVTATGKHRALTDLDQTPTDPPRKPISVAPKSGIPAILHGAGSAVAKVLGAVNTWPTVFGLGLLVIALGIYLYFRR